MRGGLLSGGFWVVLSGWFSSKERGLLNGGTPYRLVGCGSYYDLDMRFVVECLRGKHYEEMVNATAALKKRVCGVVWCGVVWCGVVWCGVVWCGVGGVVWYGVVWCGVLWCGVVWCGVVWCGVMWWGVV